MKNDNINLDSANKMAEKGHKRKKKKIKRKERHLMCLLFVVRCVGHQIDFNIRQL